MKTRLSSTEPPAPPGFVNATFAEVLEDGVRKVAVHVPSGEGISRWWARAILEGLQEPASDVLVNRYRVVLEPELMITINKCSTTAKIGPTASHFAADILRSNDNGVSWASIFSSDSPQADTDLAYVAAGDFKGDQFSFVINVLNLDDLLRVDVINNEDAAGMEIVLEGTVSLITSP
jgi:hypothetical protein